MSRRDDAGRPRRRIADYHKSRRWVERLETRQLLSDASFAALNFHLNMHDAAVDANLDALFASGMTVNHSSVSHTGTINDGGSPEHHRHVRHHVQASREHV